MEVERLAKTCFPKVGSESLRNGDSIIFILRELAGSCGINYKRFAFSGSNQGCDGVLFALFVKLSEHCSRSEELAVECDADGARVAQFHNAGVVGRVDGDRFHGISAAAVVAERHFIVTHFRARDNE